MDHKATASLARAPIGGPGLGSRDTEVNTSFLGVGGKLYAIVEVGALPVEVSYELESVARSDFGGTLEADTIRTRLRGARRRWCLESSSHAEASRKAFRTAFIRD